MENDLSSRNLDEDPMIGKLIFDRYILKKKLGSGSFGSIYSAEYENQLYAIKLEEKKKGLDLLEHECNIMCYLRSPALPIVKAYGYSSTHNILVMELMGKSLEDIFESFQETKFSVRCVCNIGYQMIEMLEFIHNKHIIHRDIKPDNFVIGLNNNRKYIYILDFGLAKKYRSSKTLKHFAITKNMNLTGTARYASINALNGLTQSRRDDLESVGYVLMYFLRGRLPWQGIPIKKKEERYRKIMEKKIETPIDELCDGFPVQFNQYLNYVRNLNYEDDPDYNYLKNLFVNVLREMGYKIDCYYDWDREIINYYRDFSICGKNYNPTPNSNSKLTKDEDSNIRNNNLNRNKEIKENGRLKERDPTKAESYNISMANNVTNINKNNNQSILNDQSVDKQNMQASNNNMPFLSKNNNQILTEEPTNDNLIDNFNNIHENDNNNSKDNQQQKKRDENKCCIVF